MGFDIGCNNELCELVRACVCKYVCSFCASVCDCAVHAHTKAQLICLGSPEEMIDGKHLLIFRDPCNSSTPVLPLPNFSNTRTMNIHSQTMFPAFCPYDSFELAVPTSAPGQLVWHAAGADSDGCRGNASINVSHSANEDQPKILRRRFVFF